MQTSPHHNQSAATVVRQPSRSSLRRAPALDLAHLSAELDGAAWAVLSFVNEDAAWGDWLYRNLNGYPVPVPIIEQPTMHGFPRPDCVSVFPDRADPNFADHYPRALETGSYLIVVCSPRSAHAAHVDEQIRAFKRAGGEERIIALVVEGGPEEPLHTLPRTDDVEWLPPWLRWRANASGFGPADRNEPRVVDARPGWASLRQVRDTLLAMLLEIERAALTKLGGCSRGLAARSGTSARVMPASSPAPSSVFIPRPPPQPVIVRRESPAKLIAGACALMLVAGAAGWFAATNDEPAPSVKAPLRVIAAKSSKPRFYATEAPLPKPPPAAPEAAPAMPNVRFPAPTARAVPAPEADPEGARPPAITTILPPLPGDAELLAETRDFHTRGDDALARHDRNAALALYREALTPGRLYATRPGADAAGKTEVAELFRQLGTLQAMHASTAEARTSFREGRRILLQIRAKNGQWSEERTQLLDAFDVGLRTLQHD